MRASDNVLNKLLTMSEIKQDKLEEIKEALIFFAIQFKDDLTVEQAAIYLSKSIRHIYKLTSRGLIRSFKPDGSKTIYFKKSDLLDYTLSNERISQKDLEDTVNQANNYNY